MNVVREDCAALTILENEFFIFIQLAIPHLGSNILLH